MPLLLTPSRLLKLSFESVCFQIFSTIYVVVLILIHAVHCFRLWEPLFMFGPQLSKNVSAWPVKTIVMFGTEVSKKRAV